MKEWRTSEAAILRKHYARDGARVCAELTGRSITAVYAQANRMGLKRQRAGETLESIKASCDIEDGCWLWRGGMNEDGAPRMWRNGRQAYARRVTWALANGQEPEKNHVILNVCGEERCVNPDHSRRGQRAKLMRDNAKRKHTQTTKLAITLRARARAALTQEAVDVIRASDECRDVLAQRFGVHRETIRRVQVGQTWAPLGSVFALGEAR